MQCLISDVVNCVRHLIRLRTDIILVNACGNFYLMLAGTSHCIAYRGIDLKRKVNLLILASSGRTNTANTPKHTFTYLMRFVIPLVADFIYLFIFGVGSHSI